MRNKWEFERAVLAPSDLTPMERLLLLCLSALANAECVIPPEFTPSLSRLKEMSGMGSSTVKRTLTSLEQKGWIYRRRPSKRDSQVNKERTQYGLKIPKGSKLSGLPAPELTDEARPTVDQGSVHSGPRVRPTVDQGSVHSGPRVRPTVGHSYTALQTSSRAARGASGIDQATRIVMEHTGATDAEAQAVAKRVQSERQPRSLGGLLRHMGADGDLAQLLAEHRGTLRRTAVAERIAQLRQGPQCIHGDKGGAGLHPESQQPLCPQCRNAGRLKAKAA